MTHVAAGRMDDGARSRDGSRTPRLLTLGTLALVGLGDAPALGPRKLALLAYLALATRPLTRDHLAELFWGDRDDARARHSLREALSALRRALGDAAIARGGDLVALADPPVLAVDARELREASATGDVGRVLALHAGPFLDGVHVAGASPAFEQWLAAERAEVERLFVAACAAECRQLRALGDWAACAAVARRWTTSAPLDPRAARALLRSLAAPGTREALRQAIEAYERLAARLEADFGLAPDPSVTALAEAYRRALAEHGGDPGTGAHPAMLHGARADGSAATSGGDTAAAPTAAMATPAAVAPAPSTLPASHPTRWAARRPVAIALAAVLTAVLAGTTAWATRAGAARRDDADLAAHPYAAVLRTAGRVPEADCWLARAMPHLLATALTRAASLETVALTSSEETAGAGGAAARCEPASADPAREAAREVAAARAEGATLVVRSSLVRSGRDYTLDLELRDARDGRPLRRVVVTDSAPFALAERAAVVLAGALGAAPGRAPSEIVGVETRSVEAYLAYVDALRHGAEGRSRETIAALDRAIAADSGFVTAVAERLRRHGNPYTPASADTLHRLALALERHLDRATPYDRLDFEATVAALNGDHARAEQLARELVSRFPHDARASGQYVGLLYGHGRFAEAVAEAERALRLDSLAAVARGGRADDCRLCLTRLALAGLLAAAGRPEEAERAARRAAAEFPDRPNVWAVLSETLAGRGRFDEAVDAAERARAASPNEYAFEPARRLVEAGRYDEAARRVRPWLAAPDGGLAGAAAEVEATRLRELGRHAEALRVLARWVGGAGAVPTLADLVRGASSAALGDARGAEAVCAALPAPRGGYRRLADAGLWRHEARGFAWSRALLADALVVAAEARGERPDTLRLRALADSIEAVGAQSALARDWRLHHHVRGLIAAQGGRWAEAAAAFEEARWTRWGWTRTLVELARAELALGRPDRALAALADARAMVLNASGRYATRTEIALWTARAFAAAGRSDSARAYAARVRAAWRDADPPIRRRLALLPAEAGAGAR